MEISHCADRQVCGQWLYICNCQKFQYTEHPSIKALCMLFSKTCIFLLDAMQQPFKDALEGGNFRSMPNSYLPSFLCSRPGVLLLGDAFNMRHPLTGAGMTVALKDVVIWRDLLKSVPDLKNYKVMLQKQQNFLWKRKDSHSFVVNVLAQALYALFSASDSKF